MPSFIHDSDWLRSLLHRSYPGSGGSENEQERCAAVREALLEFSPAKFVPRSGGESVSFEQLLKLTRDTESEHNSRVEQERETRRRLGWQRIEESYAAPDAEEEITGGRWTGFTRGQAMAWCWNLYEYEPRGFMMPYSQMRHVALEDLNGGTIPDFFGYPERAKELAAQGLTPLEYRAQRERLGAAPFTRKDVRFG